MILKDLILKYEFDTVVPDLLTIDEPIKDNLYAFMNISLKGYRS